MSKEIVLYIAFNHTRRMDVMKEMESKLRDAKVPYCVSYPNIEFGDVTYRFVLRESCDYSLRGMSVDKIFFDDWCYGNLTPQQHAQVMSVVKK